MKIAYFVHDLTDPAVERRVRALRAGGAEPLVFGFRRGDTAPADLAGAPVVDLGRTYDARFAHRALSVARVMLGAGRWRTQLDGAEAIMARMPEMLAVAWAARTACGLRAGLIYECLDIHRMMLGDGLKGRVMRTVERLLMRRSRLLIVSSPAFLEHYFEPRQHLSRDIRIPTLIVENKVLELGAARPAAPARLDAALPWVIGWMGAIRCRKSLDILTAMARRRPDLLRVEIHGRPAHVEFDDFDAQVAAAPGVSFGGGYRAEDLPRLYGGVHFSWAIDFMEEGMNSSWLLPNRVYESSRFGAIPVALESVETGRYLARRGFGIRIGAPEDLEAVLEVMTPAAYAELHRTLEAVPAGAFVADEAECRALVEAIAAAGRGDAPAPSPVDEARHALV